MGLRMISEKLDAIARGDLSGALVHPIFIHLAHLLGCVFYMDDLKRPVTPEIEASYFQLVEEMLSTVPVTLTPVEHVQTCSLFTIYLFFKKRWSDAQSMGRRANDVILQCDMHITLSAYDAEAIALRRVQRPPQGAYGHLQAVDEVDEEKSALCYALYLDKIGQMMFSLPLCLPPHLDDEFRVLAVGLLSSFQHPLPSSV